MDILGFFSDLILFTAGLAVAIFWLVILVAVAIEVYDLITGKDDDDDEADLR